MIELTDLQKEYLAKYRLQDIAYMLDRVAEEMYARNTVDRNNFFIDEVTIKLMDEDTRYYDLSSVAARMFLMSETPFWRHNFRKVEHKVNAYLFAAAIARSKIPPIKRKTSKRVE